MSLLRIPYATGLLAGICVLSLASSSDHVFAKGGTAKPPKTTTTSVPTNTVMPPPGPALAPAPGTNVNGFSVTGFVQSATATSCAKTAAGDYTNAGGTVTINGLQITIPTDTIVQFPANTLSWAATVCEAILPVSLDKNTKLTDLSVEMRIDGNIITNGTARTYIGALAYASQQSLNAGAGYISNINYATGAITVTSTSGITATLMINDPNGRFGRAMTSPDAHFSVDDANPTIKAASTGYPMCVPRVAPPAVDAQCPQKNRPTVGSAFGCRTFANAGLPPLPGGDIFTIATAGAYCPAFVMKAIDGMPGSVAAKALSPTNVVTLVSGETPAGVPDPRRQAPFEVGDFINWAGTLVRGATPAQDVIWVHTIDANVGIYTQPKTLPAYIAVGEMVVGVEPIPTNQLAVVGEESTNRLVLEAGTSDVGSIVDVYLDDKGFAPQKTAGVNDLTKPLISTANSEYFRWVSMESMTGTLADQAGGKIPFVTTAQPFGGGIQSQFSGPVAGRARIHANKVPAINPALGGCGPLGGSRACAVTQSPTRYIRVVLRSLCAPAATNEADANGLLIGSSNLDNGAWFSINGSRAKLPNSETIPGAGSTCLESAPFANGLFTGQYMAPVGEFIYPEPTLAGARIPASNFHQMGFLVYGEQGDDATAQQAPRPW